MSDEPKPITLEHIKAACEWARKSEGPTPLGFRTRKYDQNNWDCGTSCCIWGAASILSGNGPAKTGPDAEWALQSAAHILAAVLMNSGDSTPDQIENVLHRSDLRGINLSDIDLSGCDLSGCDLSGAIIWLGNRKITL